MTFSWTTAPEVATPRVMARTAGSLFLAGGIAAATVTAELPGSAGPVVTWWLAAMSTAAVVAGTLLLRVGRRLRRGSFHAVVAAGTALLTAAVSITPTSGSAVALAGLYTFIAIDAAFFFPRLQALSHLVVLLTACTVALRVHPGVNASTPLVIGVICVAIALVVGHLVEHASGASRDSLTGLPNRRGFDALLRSAVEAAETDGRPLSVALLDVDGFAAVNDRHGHTVGDDLLQAIAADCAAGLPPGATLARQGGDEFAVLLPGTAGARALELVEAMRGSVTRIRLSAGVAQHQPGQGAADLMRRADTALHSAKTTGRARSVLGDTAAVELVADLAAAISHGEVQVALQPILGLPGEQVVGFEALARWTHPTRGPVSPAEFIPAAESAGLIGGLGAAVLAGACRGAALLQAGRPAPLLLTVNASGRELTEPGYADAVLDVLASTGWPPGQLVIEVTESLVEASATAALDTLAALRSHGIAVAIDDFGTGYSAFSRLDTLPADYLKLDSSFVSAITTSPRRAGMLRALLDLSRALGLTVIAEGVEEPAQARLLAELGCPLVQGYLYGGPQPATALAAPAPARFHPTPV